MVDLVGCVALVTGASSGIGEATALALARSGADVSIVARREDRLQQLAAQIEPTGRRALVLAADLSRADSAREVVEGTASALGHLDIVVNNAGVMLLGPALEAPLGEWEQTLAINLGGMMRVAHAALPHLVRAAESSPRGVADLVNMSSVAGRVARNGSAAYNMSKFGVSGFSESLRQELAPRHVRVSVIEPGAVETELSSHIRDGVREQVRERFAHIERLHAEDIGDAIVYMVSRRRRVAVNEMLVRPTEQSA